MNRQHATPLLVPVSGDAVAATVLGPETHGWSEATIQALIQAHPACLPIREIDPLFANPVPLCTEMTTGAGPVDNVLVTATGLPVLVECKLWRNPQARREVVGQILDYAKELSRWTASDLQREVSRRTGKTVVEMIRDAGNVIDEIGFTDALTLNLRRGRFLLLIVGDGIREGVEAIAEYLQGQAGLQFTLGLIEMPIYAMPNGGRLVTPRVLARTTLIAREVVAMPPGMMLRSDAPIDAAEQEDSASEDGSRRSFMQEVIAGLRFDDPDQPVPTPTPKGFLYAYMPAPASSCWISVLDKRNKVGVRLTSNVGTVGEVAIGLVTQNWPEVRRALGGEADLHQMLPGRYRVQEFLTVDREASAAERQRAADWVRERLRTYATVFRPLIRKAVQQIAEN